MATKTTAAPAVQEDTREELISIDINDPAIMQLDVQMEIDPEADAWDRPVPPPDGLYRLKLSLGRDGFKGGVNKTKDGKTEQYFICNMDVRVVNNPDWESFPLMAKVTTTIGAGKETNQVATLLGKLGKPQQAKTTALTLCKALANALGKEPELGGYLEWRAWDQDKRGWIACGMKNFPAISPGVFNHVVKASKGGEVVAKATPIRWLSLDELKTEQGATNAKKGPEKVEKAKDGSIVAP